jgi:hypothetical protein
MESEWYRPLLDYYKLTALISVTRHSGGNYGKQVKRARQVLEDLGRVRPPPRHHMANLEKKLKWALEAPPGVSTQEYDRGRS